MAFWPENDGVALDPSRPRGLGICDYCGKSWHLDELEYQYEWGGPSLVNLHFRVCKECIDKPQEQLRSIILPPDPIPLKDPRIENYAVDEGLQGFVQNTLNPLSPYTTLSQVLSDGTTNKWALPIPATTDRSGNFSGAFTQIQIMAANPLRTFLLIYNPTVFDLGVSAGTVSFLSTGTGTTACGCGTALLQNANASTPQAVWTGAVNAMSTGAGVPFIAAEG